MRILVKVNITAYSLSFVILKNNFNTVMNGGQEYDVKGDNDPDIHNSIAFVFCFHLKWGRLHCLPKSDEKLL